RPHRRRPVHLVRRRGGEHVARTGSVQHPLADRHHVRRLMARSRSLHDRHLVVARRVGAHDQVVLGDVLELARVRELDALEHLGHELLRVVHELLHVAPPVASSSDSCHALLTASNITAMPTAPASTESRLRSPVYEARPLIATMPLVASAVSRARAAARSSAVRGPSPREASSSSTAGTSESRSVLSPRS